MHLIRLDCPSTRREGSGFLVAHMVQLPSNLKHILYHLQAALYFVHISLSVVTDVSEMIPYAQYKY